jgi:carbon monoxide dehydrogenase subunit G
METKFESKIGKIAGEQKNVYDFLSNFKNFTKLIPADKAQNWEATEDTCSFNVNGIGKFGLRIIEKEPHSLIKVTGTEDSKFNFFFWLQIKEAAPQDTRVKLTIQADLNPMVKMMASGPIQKFLDTLIDQMEKMKF